MILSITKIFGLLLLVFFSSCTRPKKRAEVFTSPREMTSEEGGPLKLQEKRVEVWKYGPTMEGYPGPRFVNKTSEYGLFGLAPTSMALVDYNQDGYLDLVIVENFLSAPVFYYFDKKEGRFILDSDPPLELRTLISFTLFVDIDGDGVLDLVTARLNQRDDFSAEPIRVYLARPEKIKEKIKWRYKEVLSPINLGPRAISSMIPGDFDLDGKIDLFLAHWLDFKKKKQESYGDLWLKGQGDGRFVVMDHLTKKGPDPSLGASSCDIDLNGRPDILVAKSFGRENHLWLNETKAQGGGVLFRNVASQTGFAGDSYGEGSLGGAGNTFFAICGDYNNDEIFDLAVGEEVDPLGDPMRDRSAFLMASAKKFPYPFIRSEIPLTKEQKEVGQSHKRGVWADLDNDGQLELLLEDNGRPLVSRLMILKQERPGVFVNKASDWGVDIVNPAATLVLDLNRDGLLDIITAQTATRAPEINPRLYVFIQSKKTNAYSLQVKLQGRKANSFGLGAVVKLKGSGKTQMRFVEYAYGAPISQLPEGIWFTVLEADRDKTLKLEVRWPSSKGPHIQHVLVPPGLRSLTVREAP